MKLTIERIGHLGDGVAQGPDGPVFVPGVLPGEEVEVDGAVMRIVTPSSDRKKPPCVHARTCGGCLMQHASDAFVETWKTAVVRGALAGQGLEAVFRPTVTSPARSRRRATLAARKTKGGALLGFHARGSDVIIPVPNCQLLHPDIVATFPALEALVKIGGSRSTEVDLTVTQSLAGPDVSVSGGKEIDSQMRLELARLAETHGIARLTWGGEVIALRTAPMQRFGKALVSPPPGAFLQATAEGEAALLAGVIEAVGGAKRVLDLFAGSGTFALPLAERQARHQRLMARIQEHDVHWWRKAFMDALACSDSFPFRRHVELIRWALSLPGCLDSRTIARMYGRSHIWAQKRARQIRATVNGDACGLFPHINSRRDKHKMRKNQ